MYSLQRSLVDYDMAMLRALACARGAVLDTNRQTEAVDQLAKALIDPLSIRVAIAQLGSQGREALDALAAAGGRMRAPQFSRRFGQVRPIGPGRLAREAPWKAPANPAEELYYLGLAFRTFYQDQGEPGEFIFVPTDLLPMLPAPEIAPAVFAVERVPEPSSWVDGGPSLVKDLYNYLVYVQGHDVRPYSDGRLGQRDLEAINEGLSETNEDRFAFIRHLAGQMGLVASVGGLMRLEATPAKKWLEKPFDDQLTALQRAWQQDTEWDELCRIPELACERQETWLPRNDPVATRQALNALLARCPLDAWWPESSFLAAVKEFHPDFQRPDGDYGSWHLRNTTTGAYLSGFDSWDRVEGMLITKMLAEPLTWLGVVSGANSAGGPIYRITESGAHFLGLRRRSQQGMDSPPIVVGPDFRIEMPAPASLYVRFQIERFADQESENPCRFRLTAPSLGRSLSRGVEVEPLIAYLNQVSKSPVPTNVVGQLRLWAGRFDQVKLEEAALLSVRNERVLKDLSVLPETRSLIGALISPTRALVRKRDLQRLRRELRSLGYLTSIDFESNIQETD